MKKMKIKQRINELDQQIWNMRGRITTPMDDRLERPVLLTFNC